MTSADFFRRSRIQFAVLAGLPIVAWLWAYTLTNLRYTYMLGVIGGVLFLWMVLVMGRFEIGLALIVTTSVVIEAELGGFWDFYGFRLGTTHLVILALVLLYASRRISGSVSKEDKPTAENRGQNRMLDILLLWFVIGFLVSLLYSSELLKAIQDWLNYCLLGAVVFTIARRESFGGHFTGLQVTLLAFGGVVAANEDMKIFLGMPLIPPREVVGYGELVATMTSYTKVGLGTVAFRPILNWPAWGGALVVSLLPIAVVITMFEKRIPLRAAGLLVSLALLPPLLAYLDRSSWLGGLLALGIVIGFSLRAQKSKTLIVPSILLCTTVLLFLDLVRMEASVSVKWLEQLVSGSDRLAIWINTVAALPHTPWLLGIGFNDGIFQSYVLRYRLVPYSCMACIPFGEYNQPHNSYLHLLIATGVLVSFAFFFMLWVVLSRGLQTLARSSFQDLRQIALLGAFASWCGLALAAAFDRQLWQQPLSLMFWLQMGVIVGLVQSITEMEAPRLGSVR